MFGDAWRSHDHDLNKRETKLIYILEKEVDYLYTTSKPTARKSF